MSTAIRLEPLTEANFDAFEKLLVETGEAGCFCSFWHGKLDMAEWKEREKCEPGKNRDTTLSRIREGFKIGVLAYEGETCVGWV